MYKFTGILLIILSVAFGGYSWWQSAIEAATTIQAPTNKGLVGYWSFEEATGTKATDFSGNGNTGTLTDMANPATATSGWGSGRLGGGLNFDGVDDYVNAGDPSSGVLDFSGAFTVSHWINPGNSIDTFSINKRLSGVVIGYDFLIGPVSTAGQAQFRLQDSITGEGNSNTATGLNDGKWHHLVGVFTGTQILIYKDGSAVGSPVSYAPAGNFLNTTVFNIAARAGASFYTGKIDEVRIYSRALSAAEITKLYQSGAVKIDTSQNTKINISQNGQSTNGLVGMWSFNGPDVSDKVYDRSGQGNNGYFSGRATSTAKTIGKVGQAFSFLGTDAVNTTLTSDTNFTGAITVSVWAKITSGVTNISFASKVVTNGATNNPFDFRTNSATPPKLALVRANTAYREWLGPNTVPGSWHHYAVTSNTSNINVAPIFYVDGVATTGTVGTGTGTGNATGSGVITKIGRRADGFVQMIGSMDEVRIYNRALTAAEVARLYQIGR
jgi:hypothetical protein